jgi:hypothetical protein
MSGLLVVCRYRLLGFASGRLLGWRSGWLEVVGLGQQPLSHWGWDVHRLAALDDDAQGCDFDRVMRADVTDFRHGFLLVVWSSVHVR